MFCNARSCGMLRLIHPNVRCRIYAIWRDVVKCGNAMWNAGVVHGDYGGVLMQDVKRGCGIPSDIE